MPPPAGRDLQYLQRVRSGVVIGGAMTEEGEPTVHTSENPQDWPPETDVDGERILGIIGAIWLASGIVLTITSLVFGWPIPRS